MDASEALRFVALITSVGGVLSALEVLCNWSELRLWFNQTWHLQEDGDTGVLARGRQFFYSEHYARGLIWTKLIGFLILLVSAAVSRTSGIVALTLAIAIMLDMHRRVIAFDGGEQMTLLTCWALALALLVPTPNARNLALAFIATQVSLAYLTAGVAKLVSPYWMGNAILGTLLNTMTYGHPLPSNFLRSHRRLDVVLSAAIGVGEVAFPVLLLSPSHVSLLSALTLGLTFHLACALFMGLNNFLFAFTAAYPAVYFAHSSLYQ